MAASCRLMGRRIAPLVLLLILAGCVDAPRSGKPAGRRRLPAEMVGDYSDGGAFAAHRLRLSGSSRYELRFDDCTSHLQVRGRFDTVDGEVVLHGKQREADWPFTDWFSQGEIRLYWVPWGHRSYLVRADQLLGFCRAAARQASPPHGPYLLKCGDEHEPIHGLPRVPVRYRRYLREPFETRVTSISHDGEIRIDRGARDGVVAGCVLTTQAGTDTRQE